MIFGEGLLGLLLVGFLVFCLLDVITSDPGGIRNLPKLVWLLLIFINPIGGIAWLIAGRPQAGAARSGLPYKGNTGATTGFPEHQRPRRSLAPDDDPEFLAELRRGTNEHEKMLGSWEDDLRKREEELRRHEHEDDGDAAS